MVNKRFMITLVTLIVIGISATVAVMLAKGYTISPQTGKILSTGLISVTSDPDGASIFIDGHLTSATNATIPSLPAKTYDVKIVKEGYIPWEKKVAVKEGLVSEVKVTLFPAIPTIYPLTFNGVANPILSPDGQKLAFGVPLSTPSGILKQKGGVWVLTMVSQPISFNRSSGFRQIVQSTSDLDFSKAQFRFSPDSKQVLVTIQDNGREGVAYQRSYILQTDQQMTLSDLRDSTPTISSTLKAWDEDQKLKDEARLVTIKSDLVSKIVLSANVVWSPDETKFIYRMEKLTEKEQKTGILLSGFKVFDILDNKEYELVAAKFYHWLPDSRHVILVQDGRIAISDFDGSNVAVLFAGNFLNSFVFPWPDSSRVVMLSSLPTPTASQPNLYGVNLR